METFKILIEGYAKLGKGDVYLACPTCTLIFSQGKKILVDPGTNRELLLTALTTINLEPADIDIVYLTHYHPDHFLNLGLFAHTGFYDGTMYWEKDTEITHNGTVIPGTTIQILQTPGHAPEHTSLLFQTRNQGTVCVAQDVFWWEDGTQKNSTTEELLNHSDPFATDQKALHSSRTLVLEKADFIIPGHGKGFVNPRV